MLGSWLFFPWLAAQHRNRLSLAQAGSREAVPSSPLEAAQGVTSSEFGCRKAAAYEPKSQIGLFLPYLLVGCGSRKVGGTGTAPAPKAGAKPGSCLQGRCDENTSVPVPKAGAGTMGTDGRGAGCAAGCEGIIATAAGMEVAAGFDASRELCGKSSFCF